MSTVKEKTIFSVGDKVRFTEKAMLEIPNVICIDREIMKVFSLIDTEEHVISDIEAFPEIERQNINHCQLLTLDGDHRKKIGGFWVELV